MTHVDAITAQRREPRALTLPRLPAPRASTDDDVLLRLALWLAEVAAEATLAATAPASAAPRRTGGAGEPPIGEPAR